MYRSSKKFFVVVCVLLLALPLVCVSQSTINNQLSKFKSHYESPSLKVIINKNTEAPSRIEGLKAAPPKDLQSPKEKEAIEKIAINFLEKNKDLLKVPIEAIKVNRIWQYKERWHIVFKTFYKEVPIYRGQVGFTLDKEGNILTYATDYTSKMEIDTEPVISKEEAIEIANQNHETEYNLPLEPKDIYLMIYQEKYEEGETNYMLAWHVFLETEAGHEEVDRVFFIDARNGEIIMDFHPNPYAITGTIQGEVYPEHSTDAVTTVAFEHEEVSVPGSNSNTNASGNYTLSPGAGNYTLTANLEGDFVKVQSYNSGTATDQDVTHTANVSDPGTHNFTWTSTNAAPDDGDGLNVFWQANRLHDDYYLAVLGINWTHDWSGTHQMVYSVNRGTANNASAGNPIKIYSNAAARNCDVTFHETTHNVLYHMFGGYIGWPSAYSEGYAFDEGFADYVACSFNNDHLYAENVHATRDCDNTMQYPGTTYNVEGHTGGQYISGMAWDLWNKEGLAHNPTDVLLFAGLNQMATLPSPYYFSNPNQSNFLTSILTADDNNNNISDGTPNDRQIFQAFRNHDLLPVDVFTKDSPQDDGNVPSAGAHWTSPDIWVRNAQDGGTTHQNPIFNQANYIYVRVRNLGYLTADTIKVKAYWADPAGGIPWPADWNYIGEDEVHNLADNSTTICQPISWTPPASAIGHRCLLVRLECSQDMMTEEGNVKLENNIGQKNVTVDSLPSGPPSASEDEGVQKNFFIKNYPKAKQSNLIMKIMKVKMDEEGIAIPIEGAQIPFKMELKVNELAEIGKVDGGKEVDLDEDEKIPSGGGCCARKIPTKKFLLEKPASALTSMKFGGRVDKALGNINIIPTKDLEEGDIYQVDIAQEIDKEIIGGLTYIIKIYKK
jgi:hypothetical protein